MLIDSHAHLTYPDFAGRVDGVLERCAQARIERVISIGTSLDDARSAITLARMYPRQIHAAAGFHPHHTDSVSEEDLAAMTRLWQEPQVVALGEMGLDYHYDFADRANQRKAFAGQLTAAQPLDKAIIIHAREAFEDVAALLVDYGFRNRRVVFHCFTGTADEAAAIAERGWRISFTGIVTFPKSDALQKIVREYPADKLMVETDSPYLSPIPVRSKKPNEPSYVAHTARFLAELRGVAYDRLCEETYRNTLAFFSLPAS